MVRILAVWLALASPVLSADTITLPLGAQGDSSVATPTRGISMSQVVKAFGEPQRIRAGVGDPPITTWQYPKFRVYFEYDKVIHSVKNPIPAPDADG
ncbi:MAG: hypothetical protein ACPGUF_05905 [Litorivicinus sp.]